MGQRVERSRMAYLDWTNESLNSIARVARRVADRFIKIEDAEHGNSVLNTNRSTLAGTV